MSGEFEVASSNKKSNNNYKRVYIGNLPNSFDGDGILQSSLEEWINEKLPDVSIQSMEVISRNKNVHALVDCGVQANHLIQSLNQETWLGNKLTVQRERRRNSKKDTGSTLKQQKKPGFGGRGWSAPKGPSSAGSSKTASESLQEREFVKIPVNQAAKDIQNVVEEEFKNAERNGEDPMNVAIASTAAASFLAAMGAFQGDELAATAFNYEADGEPSASTNWEHKVLDSGDNEETLSEPTVFEMKPMSELMADFGQADPNWKKMQPTSNDAVANDNSVDCDTTTTSQLAPKGKAPIHISLTSFGFSKGAPKRMDGWSHRQPLLPLDCREFPTVPNYLAWQDGLSSSVKRALQYPQHSHHRGKDRNTEDSSEKQSLHDFARKSVAPQVFEALLNAQNQGGHGYISPLEMTIFVGSELGRHRSVVVCEWAAIQLRKMLRRNDNNAVHEPVSVGTIHRDVEAHRQQKYNLKNGTKDGGERQGKTMKKKQMEMAGDW